MTMGYKLSVGGLIILLVMGILSFFNYNKYQNDSYRCLLDAEKIAGKYAAKKGKDLNLYKSIGTFNHADTYLHVYYVNKKTAVDFFVVELDLETCKAVRFGEKLKTDDPEIVEIANKYAAEKGESPGAYALPEISFHRDKKREKKAYWYVNYRDPRPIHDSGFSVMIDVETHEPYFQSHGLFEVPGYKTPEDFKKLTKEVKSEPCNTPGCRGN